MPSGVFTLTGFVAHIANIERDLHEVGHAVIARACELVCAEAKRVIGTYDYGWPELKPETIARKMRGDTPLLESGEMRASIEWNAEGNEGHVGSNSDIAVYQELGTSKIPPRSFLAGAAQHMESDIHKLAAKAVMAVMRGEGLHGSEMMELLHFLKHVGHELKEATDTILDGPDENEKNRR